MSTVETAESAFAQNALAARREQGMTQTALAARIAENGVKLHPSAIAKIEARSHQAEASRAVRLDEAVAIAAALCTPLSTLLGAERAELVGERPAQPPQDAADHGLRTGAAAAIEAYGGTVDLVGRVVVAAEVHSIAGDRVEVITTTDTMPWHGLGLLEVAHGDLIDALDKLGGLDA